VYNNWKKDAIDSARAIESIRDTYLPKVILGKIHTIESMDNEVLILMDLKSGVDYIREDDFGLQGIAARCQWERVYNTFTIREKRHTGTITELEKRKIAIDRGYLYPTFTLQAYFDNRENNELLSLGIIKTLELYNFVKNNPDKVHKNKSDNDFVYVRWQDLGNNVKKIYRCLPVTGKISS
jgi:hypothetical protein